MISMIQSVAVTPGAMQFAMMLAGRGLRPNAAYY
jgi:hypothetical protein